MCTLIRQNSLANSGYSIEVRNSHISAAFCILKPQQGLLTELDRFLVILFHCVSSKVQCEVTTKIISFSPYHCEPSISLDLEFDKDTVR